MNIDVFTFISYGHSEYAELLHKSLKQFQSNTHKINYKAIESVGCNYWPNCWAKIAKIKEYNSGSLNHAHAIHKAIELSESEIIVLIDADVCVLYEDWDKIIINELRKYDCFGGGYSNYKTAKYYNFPSPHLFCFGKELKQKTEMNFLPIPKAGNVKRIKIKTDEDCEIYNQPIGWEIKCDTGWQLPKTFYDNKLSSKAMKMIYNTQNVLLPFDDKNETILCKKYPMQQSEWHYGNNLFATHKQKPNNGFGKEDYLLWKKRIDMYTQNKYGLII